MLTADDHRVPTPLQRSGLESKWTVPGQYARARKQVPRQAIEEVLAAVDIRRLISGSVHVRKAGDPVTHTAHCPFHIGGHEAHSLVIDEQRFECSVCGFKGSALGWLMYHDGLGFFEALEHLATVSGITNASRPSKAHLEQDRAFRYELLRRSCAAYQRSLESSNEALCYVEGRGLSRASISRFRIGYATDSGTELLDGNRINQRSLWQAGILIRQRDGKYRPRFRHRLMFPIRNVAGQPIGFGARDISSAASKHRKYINSPTSALFNKSRILYGLYEAMASIQEQGRVFFFEGYTDVISASQSGVQNTVAALGTSITEHHLKTALSYADHLTVCLDSDAAGQTRTLPALRHALHIAADHHTIDVLRLPPGMDPDDYFRAHSSRDFLALASGALPIEQALFMNFDQLDSRHLGQMAQVGIYAADLIVDAHSRALANRIQQHAQQLLGIDLSAEIERAELRKPATGRQSA